MYQGDKLKRISFRLSRDSFNLIYGTYLTHKAHHTYNLSFSDYCRNVLLGHCINLKDENKAIH